MPKHSKPTKRQQAIINLLSVVENDGLHYGLINHGVSDEVVAIKDEDLSALLIMFTYASKKIEEKLADLGEEVLAFKEDDSDF